MKDRVGERHGLLTVIERADDVFFGGVKSTSWLCKCDCGNEKVILGSNLSRTKSCGCLAGSGARQRFMDLTGQRFGLLTVVEEAERNIIPSGQKQTMWKCVCDCGGITIVRAAHLRDGLTRSCGCVKSHGERNVAAALSERNVDYIREYTLKDCKSSDGYRLKFDFAIFIDNKLRALVEYQGEQHYKVIDRAPAFGKMQREETDKIKREYCSTHNIPLYEIRYDSIVNDEVDRILNALHDNTVPSTQLIA